MPGRGTRGKEPCLEICHLHASTLASELAALYKQDGLPLVMFGFSFAAIVAFETALALQDVHSCPPVALFVASAEPPQWNGRGGRTKDMSMNSFEDMLRAKGGTDVILNDEAMKAMYMPVIRSDMLMEESYTYSGGVLSSTAIVAFHGERANAVSGATAAGWMHVTKVGEPHSRVVALRTELEPSPQAKWLDDWYLCQDKGTAATMAEAIAMLLHLA